MSLLVRIHQWLSFLGNFTSLGLAYILQTIFILIFVGISFVALIYIFRKYMARIQRRVGPNRVGKFGLLQLIADLFKLLGKEFIMPERRDDMAYKLAPIIVMIATMLAFILLPFGDLAYFGSLAVTHSKVTLILMFGILSILPIGEILGGISTKSNYALLGTMRAVAKDISFEIPMMISVLAIVIVSSRSYVTGGAITGGLSLSGIVANEIIPYGIIEPLGLLIFFISMVARASYSPFDLGESDSELISGYTTEYSGMRFGLFYVGLFGMVYLSSFLISILYLGGSNGPFDHYVGFLYLFIKTDILVLISFLIWVTLPRIRIDKFVNLGWKYLLPLSMINLVYAGLFVLYIR
ncbi:NADH-quinone oxidoreductase subunit NuoH [Ferroplasma sp.]|uniref:NADH-quinone oxidoreductase subunit NuoH n=1 Tax=Ferroplasma sp. TaxID=2591003 RepID=UPI0026326E8B|nr:NADH-quinone oxidoreductase subunit NuoH [Ferroplasma sp.]